MEAYKKRVQFSATKSARKIKLLAKLLSQKRHGREDTHKVCLSGADLEEMTKLNG